jgi:MscS family membrane protein
MISSSSRIVRVIVLLILLGATIYFRAFYDFNYTAKTTRNVEIVLSSLGILILLKLIIDLVALSFLIRRKLVKEKNRESIIVGLGNLFAIITPIILILTAFSLFGLNPAEVFTSLSIVAAAIAVVTKEFFGELFVGITNGFSDKLDIDDYIKVDEVYGRVVEIGLQKVTIQSDDQKIVYIPNLKYHNADVINFTKSSNGIMSIKFQLRVSNQRSLEKIEVLAKEVIENHKDIADGYQKVDVSKMFETYTEFIIHYRLRNVVQEDHIKIKNAILSKLYSQVVTSENYFPEG